MLSIILPSRNEQFLPNTVRELFEKADGEIEVIVVLDGYWTDQLDPRTKIIHFGTAKGMRNGINASVAISKNKYIMKIDAHCMVAKGFDTELIKASQSNLIQIPRRKRLDAENWCIQESKKPDIDAMLLSYPDDPNDFGGKGLNGKLWTQRAIDRKDIMIDDEMSFQGSCWFMEKDYFYELELMDEENYGHFWNEAQEIGLKCWLSGGRVVRNKNTWYAHLHKGKKYGRGYFLSKDSVNKGASHTMKWMKYKQAWDKQTKPLSWLIEKFMPIPSWDNEKLEKLKRDEMYEK